MVHKIWSVKNYFMSKEEIEKRSIPFESIEELEEELESDCSYHFRVSNDGIYSFFGDIDGYKKGIGDYMKIFGKFLNEKYGLKLKEYYYTENEKKKGSYHFVIPYWNASTSKLKEIHQNFQNDRKDDTDFNYTDEEGKKRKVIDTTIYSDHWFRCPNQSNNEKNGKHIIKKGKLKYFIIDYISEKSKNIDDIQYIEEKKVTKKEKKKKEEKNIIEKEEKDKKEIRLDNNKKDNEFYIGIIRTAVNMLSDEYYEYYEGWSKVAMILKNVSKKYDYDFFELFDEFSKKSVKKYNKKNVEYFWKKLDSIKVFTINEPSLYRYTRLSNVGEHKILMQKIYEKKKIEITEKYIVQTIHEIAGEYFIFINKNMYSYNIHNKRWYNDDDVLNIYINDEIYDYIFTLLNDSIIDQSILSKQISILKNFCLKNRSRMELIASYKIRYSNNNYDIVFDDKPFLLGFTNGVYDLEKNEFRDYKYDDYMMTNTGYAYKKSNKEDIQKAGEIINQIEINDEKRDFLYQILASGFIGMHFRKFIIFNGSGGNGKSKITDIMSLILGEDGYFAKINMNSLCGKDKYTDNTNEHTAGLNMLDKKRFVVGSEPEEGRRIQNSKMKNFTGNKTFKGRKMHMEGVFYIHNHGTYVIECNQKPLLAEEATDADIERIADYLFESKFVSQKDYDENDNKNFIRNVNLDKIIEELKYGFLHLLIEKTHKFIKEDNLNFKIPQCVQERSNEYINSSYSYLEYLNELTERIKDGYITIDDLFNKIKNTDIYCNSTKIEKRKITKKSLIDFFSKNQVTRKIFKEEYRPYENGKQKHLHNVLLGYRFIENNDDISFFDN